MSMLRCMGAMDANAFRAAVRENALPKVSSLTYQGVFNEHTFYTGGPERQQPVALSAQAARVEEDLWVACFLKSCHDGQPRDGTPIDLVVVLDISGSMKRPVGSGGPRLQLAKEALRALLTGPLQPQDGFGLATFTSSAEVLQPLTRRQDLDLETLLPRIAQLRAGGGTTMAAGLEAAARAAGPPQAQRQRRLLFLTDMDDLSPGQLDTMVAEQAANGLYVSFVGIGMDFNADLAEVLTRHRGSNYFCVTRHEELYKTMVTDFHLNFFPVAFNVEVTQQSDNCQLQKVYGTSFDFAEELVEATWTPDAHRFYPGAFKAAARTLLLCLRRRLRGGLPMPALQSILGFLSCNVRSVLKVDSIFPSAVDARGAVEGGLVLLRLKGLRPSSGTAGEVRLTVRYEASPGEQVVLSQDLSFDESESEAPEALRKGLALQRYVETCREYLKLRDAPCDAGYPDYTLQVQRALEDLQTLALQFTQPELDELCPGVRGQLQTFLAMAQKHAAGLNSDAAK
ncbi:unnamed protein product [Effrenium voratum]|uniref:VWFA domain-containing protein n=1 Tax=Effrenium voratum TaxID=2562239 RepID=A0AA36NMR9_9DINO|nr:unnamed protein product [Effrenium voratum]